MENKEKIKKSVVVGIAAILVVAFAGTFVAAISNGWFNDKKVSLESEYYGESRLIELNTPTYEELIASKKSFLVLTYLPGCTASLLSYADQFANEHQVTFYYYNFTELRESSLHDSVKYTPSVAVISEGRVVDFLKADSDEDIIYYNNYADFKTWLESLIEF